MEQELEPPIPPVIVSPKAPDKPKEANKGLDQSFMLLAIGIGLFAMQGISKWLIVLGFLFVLAWGYLLFEKTRKK